MQYENNWRNYKWLYEHYVAQNMTWPQISKLVGRSATAVRLAAKQFGIISRSTEIVTQKKIIPIDDICIMYDRGLSIAEIAKHYGVAYSTIQAKLKKHGKVVRSQSVGRSVSYVYRNKMLDRSMWANYEWLSSKYQSKSINEIAQEIGWSYTAVHDEMARLGIEIRNTSYAVALKWKDALYRDKCLFYSPPKSKLQEKLYALLLALNVDFIPESEGTKLSQYYRPFDCVVPRTNGRSIIIEVNGYFHLSEKIARKDRSKATYIANNLPNYELVYLWDHDLYSTDVVGKLCKILQIKAPQHDYAFPDLRINTISYGQTSAFLNYYHYLGKGRGGICHGVFLGDELIAVSVFSPPLRQNIAQQFDSGSVRELSRLCVHPVYRRKNLISWFLSRIYRDIPADVLIAYTDTTVGHTGAVYKASNWKLHHTVPGDYYYVDSDGVTIHKRTLYSKAKSAKMTENEFADYFGYSKLDGKEKLCFIKYNE